MKSQEEESRVNRHTKTTTLTSSTESVRFPCAQRTDTRTHTYTRALSSFRLVLLLLCFCLFVCCHIEPKRFSPPKRKSKQQQQQQQHQLARKSQQHNRNSLVSRLLAWSVVQSLRQLISRYVSLFVLLSLALTNSASVAPAA